MVRARFAPAPHDLPRSQPRFAVARPLLLPARMPHNANVRAPRPTLGGGLVIIGVVVGMYACHAAPGGGAGTGTGGAGTTGHAGTTGGGGTTGVGGKAGDGGGGTGGSAGTGGNAGMGGAGGMCTGAGGSYSEVAMAPCGPMSTCDGNMRVQYQYCDQRACSGTWMVYQKYACPDGSTCGGGKCLTHVGPPAKTCSVATDCGLPPTVCVADEQLIFSDPSCDDGQCHWTQIVDNCGSDRGYQAHCSAGMCYSPVVLTGGPFPTNPYPDPMQPPPAPAQTCAATADCTQPATACFHDSVVSYVHGVCRAGTCSWEVNLDECAAGCGDGACVTP